MNESRFNSIYRGLSVVAKRIYEVVPIDDQWGYQQISSELRRVGACTDAKVVGGCLASLVSSGLITEIKTGTFSRVKVRSKIVQTSADQHLEYSMPSKNEKETKVTNQLGAATDIAHSTKSQNAIAKLGALSERAIGIGLMLKTLASDIEKAAIEIDDQGAAKDKETAKLKQLQALLKDLA